MSELLEAVAESTIEVGPVVMRVYHLSDGRRIINSDDVAEFFSVGMASLSPSEVARVAAQLQAIR